MQRQIIAMGGGGFSMEPSNLALDGYVIDCARRASPSVCFIATASGDSDRYIRNFKKAFAKFPCTPVFLSLFKPHTARIREFILEQDVIYVGGGNTRNMVLLWREWELDRFIKEAYENGTLLAGLSAGSNIWFEQCITDSRPGALTCLPALGFLKGSHCPHYNGEVNRRPAYEKFISSGEIGAGIAVDDSAAAHFVNEKLTKVVASAPGCQAYRVYRSEGRATTEALPAELLAQGPSYVQEPPVEI